MWRQPGDLQRIQLLDVRKQRWTGERTTRKDEKKWCLELTQGWEQCLLLPVRQESCLICEALGRILLEKPYVGIGVVVDLE